MTHQSRCSDARFFGLDIFRRFCRYRVWEPKKPPTNKHIKQRQGE